MYIFYTFLSPSKQNTPTAFYTSILHKYCISSDIFQNLRKYSIKYFENKV